MQLLRWGADILFYFPPPPSTTSPPPGRTLKNGGGGLQRRWSIHCKKRNMKQGVARKYSPRGKKKKKKKSGVGGDQRKNMGRAEIFTPSDVVLFFSCLIHDISVRTLMTGSDICAGRDYCPPLPFDSA